MREGGCRSPLRSLAPTQPSVVHLVSLMDIAPRLFQDCFSIFAFVWWCWHDDDSFSSGYPMSVLPWMYSPAPLCKNNLGLDWWGWPVTGGDFTIISASSTSGGAVTHGCNSCWHYWQPVMRIYSVFCLCCIMYSTAVCFPFYLLILGMYSLIHWNSSVTCSLVPTCFVGPLAWLICYVMLGWRWAVCILFVLCRYFYTFFILYSFGIRILHFLHSLLGLPVTYSQFLVTPFPLCHSFSSFGLQL